MPDLLERVAEIDSVLRTQDPTAPPSDGGRARIRDAIQAIAALSQEPGLTLAETIGLAATACPSEARRTLATVMIRLVSSTSPLTETDLQSCRREIVTLVEDECPDLTKGLFESNYQNHEKIEAIKQVHYAACDRLDQLSQPFASLQDLAARRLTIMSSINHRKSKDYLAPFGYASVHQLVESLLSQVENVIQARGYKLQTTLQQLVEDIPIQLENCEKVGTFVTAQYAIPFLKRLKMSATAMKDRLAADFACRVSVPQAALEAEKRASTLRKASKSFPEDGSSSAPSHGSTAAGDWPKIGKNPSQVHRHGYSLHISEPSRVKLQGIVIMRRVLNQTLRCQRSLPSQTGFRRRPIASTAQSGRAVGASRRGVAAIRRAADQLADNIRPVIHQIEAEGYSSLRDIAEQLNRRGV